MKAVDSADIGAAFQLIKSQSLANIQEHYDGSRPVIMVAAATCGKAAGALEAQ